MVARVKIQSPPAVAIDWRYFWYCVRDTWAKRFDMKKALPGLANSTLDNVWHGRPVGLIPFLRICKRMKLDTLKFLVERSEAEYAMSAIVNKHHGRVLYLTDIFGVSQG